MTGKMTVKEAIYELNFALGEIYDQVFYDDKPYEFDENGYKALDMAKEFFEQNQWIPCSERLPEARRSVILSTKEWTGEGCYWETTPNHIIWKGYRWNATYWDDEVTAWMPLPKPYERKTE